MSVVQRAPMRGGPTSRPRAQGGPIDSGFPRSRSYGAAAVLSAVDDVRLAGRSHVHRAIFAGACGVAELVAGAEISEAQARWARAQLLQVGLAARGPGHRAEVERTVDAGWRRGLAHPRQAPTDGRLLRDRVDALESIARWWTALTAQRAPHRRWPTTLRILAALALEAASGGRTYVSVSHRQLAETAGVAAGTISKHLNDLAPWATLAQRGDCLQPATTSSTWHLHIARANGNTPANAGKAAPRVFPDAHPLLHPHHNTWHRWPAGWATVLCLAHQDEPLSEADLAQQIGRTTRTMRSTLQRLETVGLVASTPSGWTGRLDHITAQRSTELHDEGVDHLAERVERHRRERLRWQHSVTRRRWRYATEAAEAARTSRYDQYRFTTDDGGNVVACIPNVEQRISDDPLDGPADEVDLATEGAVPRRTHRAADPTAPALTRSWRST